MKTAKLLWIYLFLFLPSLVFSSPPGIKLAKAKVQLAGGQEVYGYLFSLNDSSLELSRSSTVMSLNPEGMNNQKVAVKDISAIKLRRSHAVTGGGVLGGLSGLLLGGIIGSIAYKPCDPTPGFIGLSECTFTVIDETGATLIGAGLGLLAGSGIGILIGHRQKTFQISGNQRLFEKNKQKIEAYLPKAY